MKALGMGEADGLGMGGKDVGKETGDLGLV